MSTLISDLKRKEMDLEEKRTRFTRSASIDRIMQFNLYLCAQYYYPLPAIILWLKSSQTLIDRYIILVKTAVTLFALFAHATVKRHLIALYPKLFALSVYIGVLAIFGQFFACFYLVFDIYLPLGVMFLVSCILIISFLNAAVSLSYLRTEAKRSMK